MTYVRSYLLTLLYINVVTQSKIRNELVIKPDNIKSLSKISVASWVNHARSKELWREPGKHKGRRQDKVPDATSIFSFSVSAYTDCHQILIAPDPSQSCPRGPYSKRYIPLRLQKQNPRWQAGKKHISYHVERRPECFISCMSSQILLFWLSWCNV